MQNRPWKILYVDDNENDYHLVEAMLSETTMAQFELEWAQTFEAAKRVILSDDLDAILLDQNLQGQNGLELARYAREQGCLTPIILLTGFGSYDLDVEAMQAGINDFLEKDKVTGMLLERSIRLAIERRHTEESLRMSAEALERRVQERTHELVQVIEELQDEITERKQAEEKSRRQTERIKALAELSHLLAEAETDVQEVLDTICMHVAELVGDACTLALLSQDRQLLKAVGFYHPDPQALALLREITKTPFRAGEGAHWQVLESGQPLLLSGISQESLRATVRPDFIPYLDHFGIYTMLIVPLRVQRQWLGTLAVSRDRPGYSYSSDDQAFLKELAKHAALAIFKAQMIQTLQNELEERKRLEAELIELQRRLMDSVEVERLKLAEKLHDDAIQDLYGITFQLEGLRESLIDHDSRDQLDSAQAALRQVVQLLRITYKELRPPTLAPFGLDKAISAHAENFQLDHPELAMTLDLSPVDKSLPERISLTLFRIYQLALNNAAEHAQADQVSIRLHSTEAEVTLEVEDNGRGFEVPEGWISQVREGHYGLAVATERAKAIGGRLFLVSRPGEGTLLRVTIPGTLLELDQVN